MRVAIAFVISIILFIVLFVSVLNPFTDDRCVPSGGLGLGGEGVPSGSVSLPEKDAWDHVTSRYRTPDRPDHNGIDIAQGPGTPIFAYADGTVAEAGPASGFGQWIVIDHNIDGKSFSTVYGHIFEKDIHVKNGDTVKAGQHIADEGYNGQVIPAGPGGSHLHFEVWEGGRLQAGGHHVDPAPWLEKAVEPGSASSDDGGGEAAERPTFSGGELPDSPKIQSKDHLQVDTIRLARAVALRFPQIQTIGGWRPYDPYPDHPSGRAADIMIPNWNSEEGKRLGDEILEYLWTNREYFHVEYFIWRQRYMPAQGESNMMEDRGSPTQNHYDHIHVTTEGHGFPTPDQTYGSAPDGGSDVLPSATDGDFTDCDEITGVDVGLDSGNIPPEYVKWIELAGRLCEEAPSPLIAALIEQESGFQTTAVSDVGAVGPGQFMPGTWQSAGAEVDDNGEVIGPPGSGDPRDIPDAVMATGRYLCSSATQVKEWKAQGKVNGDTTALMLASYNAGGGNVLEYGGVPPFTETQVYVDRITINAQKYQSKVK